MTAEERSFCHPVCQTRDRGVKRERPGAQQASPFTGPAPPACLKQPGQGTHVVDGSHEQEDDANDVNGKDGSQEDQHDDLLEGERGERKLVTPLFFTMCVKDNQRANWA